MTLRGSVRKRLWGASGGWRRNGRKVGSMNRGDLAMAVTARGVRAFVVAMKRGNARGAKGGREVEIEGCTDGTELGETAPARGYGCRNDPWRRERRRRVGQTWTCRGRSGGDLLRTAGTATWSGRSSTRPDGEAGFRSSDHHCELSWTDVTPDAVNHRLESRVRENRTHGSEGGGPGGLPTPMCAREWALLAGWKSPSGMRSPACNRM